MNGTTIELEDIKNIVTEQSRIALINYDAAQKNHDSLNQLAEIVATQSRQVAVLISLIGDLLEELAQSRNFR